MKHLVDFVGINGLKMGFGTGARNVQSSIVAAVLTTCIMSDNMSKRPSCVSPGNSVFDVDKFVVKSCFML